MRVLCVSFLVMLVSCYGTAVNAPESSSKEPIPSEGRREVGALTAGPRPEESHASLSLGQTIYVPIYSHIYHRDRSGVFNLTATLSIRNTDRYSSIVLDSVWYYDKDGKLVERYIQDSVLLPPLGSVDYVVEEHDVRGGAGASFIVEWSSETGVTEPVVQAVMVSTRSSQGLSFLTEGSVLEEIAFP